MYVKRRVDRKGGFTLLADRAQRVMLGPWLRESVNKFHIHVV
jgi:hypothetical protein